MRMLNPSLAAASLLGFLTAASCTLITDVDRTKIPTDAGAQAGETGTGGTGGTGGTTGGTSGDAGTGNEGGSGGSTGGTGQGGTGGSNAGTGGTGGTSNPTPACDHATGRITIGEGTFIASGETFTLSDGLGDPVTFEFAYQGADVSQGNVAIDFDGEPTPAEFAVKIATAINGVTSFGVTATTTAEVPNGNGNGGAGGEGGATGNSGATNGGVGGEAGAAIVPPTGTQTVELQNDRAGALGNVKIKETLGNPKFTVSGMSGGSAVQCNEEGVLCDSDGECASESCVDSLCELQ